MTRNNFEYLLEEERFETFWKRKILTKISKIHQVPHRGGILILDLLSVVLIHSVKIYQNQDKTMAKEEYKNRQGTFSCILLELDF